MIRENVEHESNLGSRRIFLKLSTLLFFVFVCGCSTKNSKGNCSYKDLALSEAKRTPERLGADFKIFNIDEFREVMFVNIVFDESSEYTGVLIAVDIKNCKIIEKKLQQGMGLWGLEPNLTPRKIPD